jgi:hypothetical protein
MTLVGLLYRIDVEKQAWLDEQGASHRTYAGHHRRTIPFVW